MDLKRIKEKKLRKAKFEDLRIWQEAHKLMLIVHGIANKLPLSERDKASQMKRSSSSVPDNIAEGCLSYYYNNKLKSMYTARREAGETQNHLKAIGAKGYVESSLEENLISRYEGLIIGINNYIKYILRKREKEKKK